MRGVVRESCCWTLLKKWSGVVLTGIVNGRGSMVGLGKRLNAELVVAWLRHDLGWVGFKDVWISVQVVVCYNL